MYKMRRVEKQLSKERAFEIMSAAEYATIAAILPDGTPYAFTVSHGIAGETVYFHSALEGLKCTAIEQNPRVCITAVGSARVISERFTTEYQSAVAFGMVRLVSEDAELLSGFEAICSKFSPGHDWQKYCGGYNKGVKLYAIDLHEITGKGNIE